MSECVFCGIAKGQIPAKKVAETDSAMAFLDINPRSKGHTVVIPKEHAATLSDLPSAELGPFFGLVKNTANMLVSSLEADGYNVGINNGEMAGQVVPHVHVHIIPRYKEDQHHAGFEAAFPVDEGSKNGLDGIASSLGEVDLSDLPGTVPAPEASKEPEPPQEEKKEGEWEFLNDDEDESL